MRSRDIRETAREALRGNWFVAVIAGFIASLLGGISGGGVSVNFELPVEDTEGLEVQSAFTSAGIDEQMLTVLLGVFGIIAAVALVYGIIQFIIGSAVGVGYAGFNLDLVDGGDARIGTLFGHFDQIGVAIRSKILVFVRVFLLSLLFVIPGIVASYSYAMVNYVLAENPGMNAREALAESKRVMKGNRWRLFCLQLSFIGWNILCLFTLGIGYLWLVPYEQASYAAFYSEAKAAA